MSVAFHFEDLDFPKKVDRIRALNSLNLVWKLNPLLFQILFSFALLDAAMAILIMISVVEKPSSVRVI